MSFRSRYNHARYAVGILFAALVVFATSTEYSFELFLGLAFAFAVTGWLLTTRGLRCPHCEGRLPTLANGLAWLVRSPLMAIQALSGLVRGRREAAA